MKLNVNITEMDNHKKKEYNKLLKQLKSAIFSGNSLCAKSILKNLEKMVDADDMIKVQNEIPRGLFRNFGLECVITKAKKKEAKIQLEKYRKKKYGKKNVTYNKSLVKLMNISLVEAKSNSNIEIVNDFIDKNRRSLK